MSEHIKHYNQLNYEIEQLSNQLSELQKVASNAECNSKTIQGYMDELSAMIQHEERAREVNSRLVVPKMNSDELRKAKQQLAEFIDDKTLQDVILEGKTSDAKFLQNQLMEKRRLANEAFRAIAGEMKQEALTDLLDASGEPLKRLILSHVATVGQFKGFTYQDQQGFDSSVLLAVGKQIVEQLFGGGVVPDLDEANQHVVDTLNSYLA